MTLRVEGVRCAQPAVRVPVGAADLCSLSRISTGTLEPHSGHTPLVFLARL